MPDRVRPHLLRMEPYPPGKPIEEVQRELGLTDVVKLASNENPFGPSPRAIEAVHGAARSMNVYPDARAYTAKQAIAAFYGIAADHVLMGNGSDELIHLLGLVMLGEPHHEVVMGAPSFLRYGASALLADCVLKEVPLDGDWRHDLTAMARAVTPNTRLVFVANPNNPTGTVVGRGEVDAFLRDLPPGALLVLDEAYYEFAADREDYPDSVEYVRSGAPVVGLRTFSKAYGLAGLRIGYGFAPLDIVDAVNRVREPFDVNSLAQAAVAAALADQDHVRMSVDENRKGLERIAQSAQRLGLDVVESFANFVCIDVKRPARPVFDALLRQGVIVRCGDVFGMPQHLRVSVGTPAEVERFLTTLEAVVAPQVTA